MLVLPWREARDARRAIADSLHVVSSLGQNVADLSERSHVPAERLARALGRDWWLPSEELLVRVRGARRQAGLRRDERRANIRGLFATVGRAPPRVALIDDVYTTGATASACASVLRKAGARHVDVVCLSRAVR